jgi:UDP-glucose 4-epimerase
MDFRVDFAARRPGDPARIVAAADRARALLGWEPSLAWERKRITLGSGQAHVRLISP